MLRTRMVVGSTLIVLVVAVLVVDRHFAPWFPFLFLFVFGLSQAACFELLRLLRVEQRPPVLLCHVGLALIVAVNWAVHLPQFSEVRGDAWHWITGIFLALTIAAFLWEMAQFTEPGHSVIRISIALWLLVYLGLLPSCLAQLRWFANPEIALALAIFVPKSCDIGAYFTGRFLGRHKMSPVLSPKKTLEGAIGGLVLAALVALGINRYGPPVLPTNVIAELGFGVTVGFAGMMGDLAESLIKRDCEQKDASQAVPGFGGVLDVVDAVIFAAPVALVWFVFV